MNTSSLPEQKAQIRDLPIRKNLPELPVHPVLTARPVLTSRMLLRRAMKPVFSSANGDSTGADNWSGPINCQHFERR